MELFSHKAACVLRVSWWQFVFEYIFVSIFSLFLIFWSLLVLNGDLCSVYGWMDRAVQTFMAVPNTGCGVDAFSSLYEMHLSLLSTNAAVYYLAHGTWEEQSKEKNEACSWTEGWLLSVHKWVRGKRSNYIPSGLTTRCDRSFFSFSLQSRTSHLRRLIVLRLLPLVIIRLKASVLSSSARLVLVKGPLSLSPHSVFSDICF